MVTRLSGFSSGLDIDDLVKKLMANQKAPLNKLNQQKVTIEWQREQYRNINSKLVDFRNNKLFNYGLSSSISAKQVTISGGTSEVTATAASDAVVGTMSVKVNKLAAGASLQSAAGSGIGSVDLNKSLLELKGTSGLDYTLNLDGKIEIDIGGGSSILLEESDSLAKLVSKLNSSKEANVSVFLDSHTGEMSITSKTTGDASSVNLSGSILDSFNLGASAGNDAELVINGITTKRSSNTFTESGVVITLNGVSSGNASNIKVSTNTDKIMDTIKSFITDYNSLLDSVNNTLNEERYRKYLPLTDDQRKEMSDDEIKLWEGKAKSGMLRNDPTLSTMVSDIRLASITSVVINGTSVNLTTLGITTGAYTERGKLVIQNEAKLRSAIESDPDSIIKFFTQQTKETDTNKKNSATNPDNGLFNRLSNIVMKGMERLAEKAGTSKYSTDLNGTFLANSMLGDQLRSIDKRIDTATLRLNMMETRYYKQFTAMEKAINRYSAQSGIFSS